MTTHTDPFDVVTITLNPAIDRSVTIRDFAAGRVNRAEQVISYPGGKGVNVASVLADYGHRVAVTGILGSNNSGSFETLFARKNITDHFVRTPGQTRVGIKIMDPAKQETTDINFPGPTPRPADLDELRARVASLDARWFVLAGSLPQGVDEKIYRDLVQAVKARGYQVAIDTSGEPLRHALEAAPHLIKPNIHELEAMLGRRLGDQEAVVEAAQELTTRGIGIVVVSMGRDGACLATRDGVVIARPPEVEVVSTVGAGDAMVAGLVAGQLRGLSLDDCARMATAFSLEALSRIESGLSSPEAIGKAMTTVTVHRPQYF